MKSVTVKKNDEGQRLDKFLQKKFSSLPKSMMFKQIRKKNIKVNKKRCTPEQIIKENDVIYFQTVENKIRLPQEIVDRLTVEATGQDVLLGIRPENIDYADDPEETNVITVNAKNVEQVGSDTYVYHDSCRVYALHKSAV